jgi:hypothetical protein
MPRPRVGQLCFADSGLRVQARAFGGQELIAAEETRSCTGRQDAEVASRADAARARPRPAFGGWNRLQSA